MSRPLRVFLCHASQDKPAVRELYGRLDSEGWMDVWLDEEKLYPVRIGILKSKRLWKPRTW